MARKPSRKTILLDLDAQMKRDDQERMRVERQRNHKTRDRIKKLELKFDLLSSMLGVEILDPEIVVSAPVPTAADRFNGEMKDLVEVAKETWGDTDLFDERDIWEKEIAAVIDKAVATGKLQWV